MCTARTITAAGTFGCHVRALGLLRSDGSRRRDRPRDAAAPLRRDGRRAGPDRPDRLGRAAAPAGRVERLRDRRRCACATSTASSASPRTATTGPTRWPGSIASPPGATLGRGLFNRGRHAAGGPLLPHAEQREAEGAARRALGPARPRHGAALQRRLFAPAGLGRDAACALRQVPLSARRDHGLEPALRRARLLPAPVGRAARGRAARACRRCSN